MKSNFITILDILSLETPSYHWAKVCILWYTLLNQLATQILETGGLATVSHHSSGQSFPSWIDSWGGCSVEPNPSFTHTVPGLWLERESRERKERDREDKSGEGNEMAGL